MPQSNSWTSQSEPGNRRGLTPLQRSTVAELGRSAIPLDARSLAARVSRQVSRSVAPESIYRVLRALGEAGLVYRIASRRSFLRVPSSLPKGQRACLLCERCGQAALKAVDLERSGFSQEIAQRSFTADRCVLEVHGLCRRCSRSDVGP